MDFLGQPEDVKRTAKAIATLDLILSPEWERRYFSYDCHWSDGEEMASMRNGAGDEWFLLFLESGWCGINGLDHESDAGQVSDLVQRIRSVLPEELAEFGCEPAFDWDQTSFCYWYEPKQKKWIDAVVKAGLGPGLATGADDLLRVLVGDPAVYLDFVEQYYERNIPLSAISHVYQLEPLSVALVHSLNPDIDLNSINAELKEIGYPTSN